MTRNPDKLFTVLNEVEPLKLEGSVALLSAQRVSGSFFPTLKGLEIDSIVRMAVEVKHYTERCWAGIKRLFELQPIPALLYIVEFGL